MKQTEVHNWTTSDGEPLSGIKVIDPVIHQDDRGQFLEVWSDLDFTIRVGTGFRFVQDNQSISYKGVFRGLHWQKSPMAQAKLVRCVRGEALDFFVDIRLGSPTFGKYGWVYLSSCNFREVFIPEGFAHGFLAGSPMTVLEYKCANSIYDKESERGISIRSIDLSKDVKEVIYGLKLFPNPDSWILSDKDTKYPVLEDVPECDLFLYQ